MLKNPRRSGRQRIVESLDARLLLTGEGTPLLTASVTAEVAIWAGPEQQSKQADFNGDGRIDEVATSGATIEIFFADESGNFGEPNQVLDFSDLIEVFWLDRAQVNEVIPGDLNGDGHIDFVATIDGVESTPVVVMLNNGEGFFKESQQFHLPRSGFVDTMGRPRLLDVDGDGQLDLVAGSFVQTDYECACPNLFVWRATELGKFSEQPEEYTTIGGPLDMAVGDIDEDGFEDLLVGHSDMWRAGRFGNGPGGVSVLLGTSSGKFQDAIRISTQEATQVVFEQTHEGPALVALDGPDRATRYTWNFEPIVQAYGYSEDLSSPRPPSKSAWFGQFNRDGRTDVITKAFGSDSEAYFSTDDDHFSVVPFSHEPRSIGDFNNDGLDDILLDRPNGGLATVLSNGDNTFSGVVLSPSIPSILRFSTLVDINNDGTVDLVGTVFDVPNPYVAVALGNGDGSWTMGDRVSLGDDSVSFSEAPSRFGRLVDLNADGHLDALTYSVAYFDVTDSGELFSVGEAEYSEFKVRFGDGQSFSDSNALPGFRTTAWSVGDVNNDGYQDIVAPREFQVLDTDERSHGLHVAFGSADGNFNMREIALDIPVDENDRNMLSGAMQLVDVNSDGVEEVVLFANNGIQIAQSENDTDFRLILQAPLGFLANKVFVEDVTGDEVPDIIVNPETLRVSSGEKEKTPSMTFAVLQGKADGTFAEPTLNSAQFENGNLALIAKGDRRVDFYVRHQAGFGKFQATIAVPVHGDFDGNRQIDALDIDLLCSATRSDASTEEQTAMFDQNGDMLLTSSDVETWIADVANTKAGDTDIDGDVDFADFLNLSTKFGTEDALWSDGDFNCDGEVSFADFLLMSENFGTTAQGKGSPG